MDSIAYRVFHASDKHLLGMICLLLQKGQFHRFRVSSILAFISDECGCCIAAGLKDTPKDVVLERTIGSDEGAPGLPQLLR